MARTRSMLVVANLALLVATSETTGDRPPSSTDPPGPGPSCAPADVAGRFEVDDQGALSVVLTAGEVRAIEGSLWLFAHPELACRAAVTVRPDGGPLLAGGEEGTAPHPLPDAIGWIPAGAAWEVPTARSDLAAEAVAIDVAACPGVGAELDLTVEACGEVRLEAPEGGALR